LENPAIDWSRGTEYGSDLTAGQPAALPGGVPHSANVPGTDGAVSLNVFTYRERPPEA
jgi:hypothetical protein